MKPILGHLLMILKNKNSIDKKQEPIKMTKKHNKITETLTKVKMKAKYKN